MERRGVDGNSSSLTLEESEKDLGILIDDRLSFKDHVAQSTAKVLSADPLTTYRIKRSSSSSRVLCSHSSSTATVSGSPSTRRYAATFRMCKDERPDSWDHWRKRATPTDWKHWNYRLWNTADNVETWFKSINICMDTTTSRVQRSHWQKAETSEATPWNSRGTGLDSTYGVTFSPTESWAPGKLCQRGWCWHHQRMRSKAVWMTFGKTCQVYILLNVRSKHQNSETILLA